MKKVLYSILFAILVLMPTRVFAAGYISPSTGSLSIQQGSSTSFSITAYNAIGDVTITSSNPSVATVSTSSWSTGMVGSGETKVGTVTVTGVGVGAATITLTVDGASFDDEDLSGQRTITVNVTAKPEVTPSTPTPSNPSTPTPSTPADTRSTNTKLSKLTVNGKELSNYTLEVGNYVEKVDIAATAADSKAKVSGAGSKELKVGENVFDIVVTAEKGNTTTYTVKIIRKEYNTLSDLDELLKLNKDVEIRITDNDKLIKAQLDKIAEGKNKVTLSKVNEENKILYSFILDGSKLKSVKEFNPNITKVVENNSDMEEALNYADGIYLDFSNCGDIPKGIVLRYYVGDKYNDDDKVNIYAYSSKKVTQLKENVSVKDGYIEIEVTDSIKHFISKSKVLNAESNEMNVWFTVSMALAVVVIALIGVVIRNKIKSKNSKVKAEGPREAKKENMKTLEDELL